MYKAGEYDLAGFSVGEVFEKDILGGEKVAVGNKLIGLASSGFHSNGYSLLRKVLEGESTETKKRFLAPTKIYWKQVKDLLSAGVINGMSHVTGGGLTNIARMNPDVGYSLDVSENNWRENIFSEDFRFVMKKGDISFEEMMKTFNGGIGLVLAVENSEEIINKVKTHLQEQGQPFFDLGYTVKEHPGVVGLDDYRFS
jgi:phosphoribosylformylglycinamidine cyclo-ligase